MHDAMVLAGGLIINEMPRAEPFPGWKSAAC
jgi:hypothetical protein